MKNECNKTRPVSNPYEVWQSVDGTWEWKVLKKYQSPEKEKSNQYARWFCAVYSPITREQCASGYELGDVYVTDIIRFATKIK